MSEDEILFEIRGHAGLVTLNRPKALNALTHGMVTALAEKLEEWREQWPLSDAQRYVAEQFTVHGMIVPPSLVRRNIPIKKRFGEGEYAWLKRKAVNERFAFTKALYEFHGQEYPDEYPKVEEAFQEPGSDSS